MSENGRGLYAVVDAVNAIGDAAVATAGKLLAAADAAESASTSAGISDGSGGDGSQRGQSATTGGDPSNTTAGIEAGVSSLKFGTVKVKPLGAGTVIADLKSLRGRK